MAITEQEKLDNSICVACCDGNLEQVKELHKKGADVILNNYTIINASSEGHLDIVKYLIENGADVNDNNSLPLKFACRKGYTDMAKYLIENGADVNANDGYSDYYINIASQKGHYKIVKLLAENGADANAHAGNAIGYASADNDFEMVKFLHQKGGDLDKAIEWANPSFKEELLNYKTSLEEQKILSNDLKEIQAQKDVKKATMRI